MSKTRKLKYLRIFPVCEYELLLPLIFENADKLRDLETLVIVTKVKLEEEELMIKPIQNDSGVIEVDISVDPETPYSRKTAED